MMMFQPVPVETTVVAILPRGAMNHQLIDELESPGKRAMLNSPKERKAPPAPLDIEEQKVAAVILQNATKIHLEKNI